MRTKHHYNSAHNVVTTFKPSPKPQGRCQHTIIKDGRARVCNTPCKGQLCDDCKAHTDAVKAQYRGAGMLARQMDGW